MRQIIGSRSSHLKSAALALALLFLFWPAPGRSAPPQPFQVVEATIEEIHAAYKSGELTSRQLVQLYLDRIAKYDQKGPSINAIITLNPHALEDADRLDAAFKVA